MLHSKIGTTGKVNIIKRNLGERYKEIFSITQELLQNADDAKAEHILIGTSNGFSKSHDLTKTFGLFFINDGPLTKNDLEQIFSVADSNKSSDTGKIGKFGLGMKSVFHLCEAFMVFGKQDKKDIPEEKCVEMFDPWDTEDIEELKQWSDHYKWRIDFEANHEVLYSDISKEIAPVVSKMKRWFCVWIPFRRPEHCKVCGDLFSYYPEPQDIQLQYNRENCLRIIHLFPFMKSVKEVAFFGDLQDLGVLSAEAKKRFQGGLLKRGSQESFSAKLKSSANLFSDISLQCVEKVSSDDYFESLKKSDQWPTTQDGGRRIAEKAIAHHATAFMEREEEDREKRTLKINYYVYLPLTDSDMQECIGSQSLPCSVSLDLHAHLFIDAGRRRFETFDAERPDEIKTKWNRELLNRELYPSIIEYFPSFFAKWKNADVAAFTKLFLATMFFQQHGHQILDRSVFVNALQKKSEEDVEWKWIVSSSDTPCFKLPAAEDSSILTAIKEAFPSNLFVNASHDNILCEYASWTNEMIEILLEKVFLKLDEKSRYSAKTLRFIRDFIPLAADVIGVSFFTSFFADITSDAYRRNKQIISEIFSNKKRLFRPISFAKDASSEAFETWKRVAFQAKSVIPMALDESYYSGAFAFEWSRYSEEDLVIMLQQVEKELCKKSLPKDSKIVLSKLVCDMIANADCIIRIEAGISERNVFITHDGRIVSLNEILKHHVFRNGGQIAFLSDLKKIAPSIDFFVLDSDICDSIEEGLHLLPKDKYEGFSLRKHGNQLLESCPPLSNDLESRIKIIRELATDCDQNFGAIRYLLHGSKKLFSDYDDLWIPDINNGDSQSYDFWTKMLNILLASKQKQLVAIPQSLIEELSANQLRSLGIIQMSPRNILEQFSDIEIPPKMFDGFIQRDSYKHIVAVSEIPHYPNLIQTVKRLPIFPVYEKNDYTALDDCTFLEEETAIPSLFFDQVKALDVSDSKSIKFFKDIQISVWSALSSLRFSMDERYQENADELRSAVIDSIEGLASDERIEIPAEEFSFLRKEAKIIAVKNSNKWISFSDILNIQKLNFGSGSSADDFGLYYYPDEIEKNVSNPDWKLSDQAWNYVEKNLLPNNREIIENLSICLEDNPKFFVGEISDDLNLSPASYCNIISDSNIAPASALFRSLLEQGIPCDELMHNLEKPLTAPQVIQIINFLVRNWKKQDVFALYKDYLRQSTRISGFIRQVLPKIKLINQAGEVKDPAYLVHSVDGVSNEYQLMYELCPIVPKTFEDEEEETHVADLPVFNDSRNLTDRQWNDAVNNCWRDLEKYFYHWDDSLKPFIGLLIILADDSPTMHAHIREYLDQDPQSLRERISPEFAYMAKNCCLFVKLFSGEARDLISVTGQSIKVPLSSLDEMENLLVGDSWYSCIPAESHKKGYRSFFLALRELSKDELKHLGKERQKQLLKATVDRIIARYKENGVRADIEEIWEEQNRISQFDLETVQRRIANNLIEYLAGIDLRDGTLQELLNKWDDLDNDRTKAEKYGQKEREEAIKINLQQCRDELVDKFLSQPEIQNEVLSGLREKMEEQFGYDVNSIPYELFQNADDAAVEHLDMVGIPLEKSQHAIVIRSDIDAMDLIHWGRPINKYNGYGFKGGREAGYQNDLRKMMLLHRSSKTKSNLIRTGKFGLGFKSIFFLTDRPLIASGPLKFFIAGGMYPENAGEDEVEQIKEISESLSDEVTIPKENMPPPTTYHIPLRKGADFPDFKQLLRFAPFLSMFSKAVHHIKIIAEGCPITEFLPETEEIGSFCQYHFDHGVSSDDFAAFHLKHATIVMGYENGKFSSVGEDIPTIWVVAPTKEYQKLGFVINAAFRIDVGRTKLIETSDDNSNLAKQIGNEFNTSLSQMFQGDSNIDLLKSLWDVLTGGENCGRWQSLSTNSIVSHAIRPIIWGTWDAPSGYGQFLLKHNGIPTGLPDEYDQMVSLSAIKKRADAILSNQLIWRIVKPVAESLKLVRPGVVIGNTPASALDAIYSLSKDKLPTISLFSIFSTWRLTHNSMMTPALLNPIPWKHFLETLQQISENDYKSLLLECEKYLFLNESGECVSSKDLVWDNPKDQDEQLLYAFAPDKNKLSSKYNDDARFLLQEIRTSVPSGEVMAEWAIYAPAEKRKEVLNYLAHGERRKSIERALNEMNCPTWLQSRMDQLHTYEQMLFTTIDNNYESEETNNEEDVSPLDLSQLSATEIKKFAAEYNNRVYGQKKILPLPWDLSSDDARDRWMELFILAMSQSLGRTTDGQGRNFIKLCHNIGWFDVLRQNKIDKKKWIEVLDTYMDQDKGDLHEYRYWMSLYPGIYQMSKYLNGYVEIFQQWDDNGAEAKNVMDICNYRTSALYRGTDIDLPTLRLGFGRIGFHWLIRELIRSKTVTNASWHPYCFVPTTTNCKTIECMGGYDIKESIDIYSFLEKQVEDPTFNLNFDVAFEALKG